MPRPSLFSTSGTPRPGTSEPAAAGGLFAGASFHAFQEEGGPTFRHGPPGASRPEPTFEDEWQALLAVEGGIADDGTWKTSRAGAVGPAQIIIRYGPDYAKRAGLPWDEHRARTDVDYNLALGRGYYAWLRHIYDAPTAAAAYNLGPYGMSEFVGRAVRDGHPEEWTQSLPVETREHVRKFGAILGLPSRDPDPAAGRRKRKWKTAPTRLTPNESDPWTWKTVGQ